MRKKLSALVWTICCLLLQQAPTLVAKETKRPNIVFIYADDLGVMDVGFMGDKRYHTPNIDKFSKEGMVFTNAYAAASNCAPSRGALLSGQWASRTGMYTVGNPARGDKRTRKLKPIKNNRSLPEDDSSLLATFKANGYLTCQIGKWHVGKYPKKQGVDISIGGGLSGQPKLYYSPYQSASIKDGPEGEYLTDRVTNEAIKFLASRKDKPFFLYFPYFSIHTPLEGRKDLIEKYNGQEGFLPHYPLQKGQDIMEMYEGQKGILPHYAAMVHAIDENIGRLLAAIDELGLRENTIVVFTSDNGGIAAYSDQAPYRAGKGSYYEGGVREPMVVRWPGRIKPGSRCDVPVTQLDFYPTLLSATGVKARKDIVLDGVDIMPLLTQSGNIKDRALYWHFPIYIQGFEKGARDPLFRTRPGSTMRYGQWKLHEYFEDGAFELYDLENDLGEKNNLAQSNPKKLKELKDMLNAWRKETNSPVPTELNPKYIPNFVPPKKHKKKS
jgi:arylsulfatase A-like enzyme